MANIHIKHPYQMMRDDAKMRVEEIAKKLKKEYKMDYGWKGSKLDFRRSGASGFLELGDGTIELNIKLGMLLAPVKGNIESSIRQNLEKEFGKG